MIKKLSLNEKKKRARKIINKLKKLYPKTKSALNYSNDFELLAAVIMSAQCTDKMVNIVTDSLYKKYKSVEDFASANLNTFEKEIKSTGFYRNKAKNIINCANIIINDHNSKVPDKMEDLLRLPGIARKSANIIIYLTYGKTEGIAVDTHVKRLSKVLGLSNNTNPVKIEKDLIQILPKEEWMDFSFRLVDYGREFCKAKKHNHENCPLTKLIS
ncbi:MAG: endonuclease III [Patescibacteria group bacterium]